MQRFARVFGALLIMGFGFAGIGGVAAADNATPAAAPKTGANAVYREMIWGDAKAKVTVVEFASLTCPHCARFQQTVFPEIKKNYIDTGKIRFVFKDFPFDDLAMAGAVLARCAPGDRAHKLLELMFKNQNDWIRAQKPLEPLRGYAQLAGMSSADVDGCLKNTGLLQSIKDEQQKAQNLYQIQATPTFYVGNEKVEGERTYEEFAKVIDKQLSKAK